MGAAGGGDDDDDDAETDANANSSRFESLEVPASRPNELNSLGARLDGNDSSPRLSRAGGQLSGR